jgi:uncharacterized membrane protein (UPF0127 family)
MHRALLALLLTASCPGVSKDAPGASGQPTGAVRFETNGRPWVVHVEVANNDAARAKGLMFRRELRPDTGMIFIFPAAEEQSFWMHNTLISLDMIFLGDDRAVVGVIDHAEPRTDTPRTVHKPSRYVIEVSAGEAAAHGVGTGTRAVFIDLPE